MHLTVILYVLAFGVILINAASIERKLNEVNDEKRAKRIRRMPSPMEDPTFPPRPCINDSIVGESESSGEESRERRDTANKAIRRVRSPMDPTFPPRPCINDTVVDEPEDPEEPEE